MFKNIKFIILSITLLIFFQSKSQSWVEVMLDTTRTQAEKSEVFDTYWQDKTVEKGKGFKQFKRNEYFVKNRIGQNNQFNQSTNIVEDYRKIQQNISQEKSLGTAGKWVHLGPFGPVPDGGSGRVNCIDFHPSNSSIIMVGAPSGGLWRSTDGGLTWNTNTDDLASIGFSDLAFAPSNGNIVYAATGDKDASDTYAFGILKSIDAGITWSNTSWTADYNYKRLVYRLIVHPSNSDIVYATTSLGFYITIDGGVTWTKKRVGVYKDMEIKPDDPNTVYLATTSSILKSTDAGNTFNILSGFALSYQSSRIEIEVSANDANYVYALAAKSSDNGFGGLYVSTDAGATFTTKATTPNLLGWTVNGTDAGGQAWYDLALEVSPTNKNLIFVGGVNVWRSINGGSSWAISGHWTGANGKPYVHADIHSIKASPHSATEVWACTDGGLSFSANNGASWTERNSQLAIAQIYRMGSSKTVASKILTGWQDNGSNLLNSSWSSVLGGDGMECIIRPDNNNIMFGSLYYGDLYRSVDGGSNWSEISNSITEEGAWVTPYILDPVNPSIIYAGYYNVWKSVNQGSSWTQISSFNSSYQLDVVAVAPSNTQVIWACNASQVYKTTDGGSNWSTISTLPSSGSVNAMAINQVNPNLVWVAISGFYAGDKVYESSDGGLSWTNISGSLPNYPVNTIVNDPNSAHGLYIGTDLGVYYLDDNLTNWIPFMKDLPNVIVTELELYLAGNKVRAATYGRGVWESLRYPLANAIGNQQETAENWVRIYPNPAKDVIYIDFLQKQDNKIQLSVFNSLGDVIYTDFILNNQNYSLNTAQFMPGLYFVKVESDSQIFDYKIIIL